MPISESKQMDKLLEPGQAIFQNVLEDKKLAQSTSNKQGIQVSR